MADWKMSGTYIKSCNCEPGCPCDFMSTPTHHSCTGIAGMEVEQGNFDGVSLNGTKWLMFYHWPGPLHEGNGTAQPYFDTSTTPEQLDSFGKIFSGEVGGTFFEILSSIITTVKDPVIGPIEFKVSGKTGTIKAGGMVNEFGPINNPVTSDEVVAQTVLPGGFEYDPNTGAADILQSQTLRSTDAIAFDCTGSHTSLVAKQTFGSHR